jgi:hypothetical protein
MYQERELDFSGKCNSKDGWGEGLFFNLLTFFFFNRPRVQGFSSSRLTPLNKSLEDVCCKCLAKHRTEAALGDIQFILVGKPHFAKFS